MKKIIALLLVLGFSMPSMAAVGENEDGSVRCEEIFQGTDTKNVSTSPDDDKSSGTSTQQK